MTKGYFKKREIAIWVCSTLAVIASFCIFDRINYLNLAASLVGVSALIFCAKGNPIGQMLIILFSTLYGIISFNFAYYGELLTYAGMSLPMAIIALVSWLRHPYNGSRSQVEINKVSKKEFCFAIFLSLCVTVVCYFALAFFGTKNLWVSTFSVSTSFLAVYLTSRRSPYFALAYALNDVVLIILWALACFEDISYMSTVICFLAFLVNDVYSFTNWKKMQKQQAKNH